MKGFSDFSIGKKLFFSFFILVLLSALLGLVGVRHIYNMAAVDKELYQENTVPLADLAQAAIAYQQSRVTLGQAILEQDPMKRQQYIQMALDQRKRMNDEFSNFTKNPQSTETMQAFERIKVLQKNAMDAQDEVVRAALAGNIQEAQAIHTGKINQVANELSYVIDNLIELQVAQAGYKEKSNELLAKTATQEMSVLLIVSLIAAILMTIFITLQITKPIRRLQDLMTLVEKGDLTVQESDYGKDELGQLTVSFNHLIRVMHNMTQDISNSTGVLNQASERMLSVSESVAANSEEMSAVTSGASQAAETISQGTQSMTVSIQEAGDQLHSISAATEEISATIQSLATTSAQTSANLLQVSHLIEEVSEGVTVVAGSSKEISGSVTQIAAAAQEINSSLSEVSQNCEESIVVSKDAETQAMKTTAIMNRLSDLSRQIGKVVNLIDDIADQTNMLALNAAIEAAGAGEAGRGFAVVANEVKELAKQTSHATDDIAEQIERMQSEINDAVVAVGGITTVISSMSGNSHNIAAAVTEQSAVVGNISDAIVQAADKVNLISDEISKIADKSAIVAHNAAESSVGVEDIALSVGELSSAASQLAQSTEKVSSRMEEVVKSSQLIAANIEEISHSMGEISKASGDTATKGEETRQAADDLVHISGELTDLARRFKV
ncbi:MAG: methyl-accepting chemotaxis protein [Sporomusaceae bacterium]|nr:methyl-accepting chemotaxis protein [Sporomusaceae bacterium]